MLQKIGAHNPCLHALERRQIMSIAPSLDSSSEQSSPVPIQYRRWRLAILCMLLFLAIGFNVLLSRIAPPIDSPVTVFVMFWLVSFLPYFAACVLILVTRPLDGRWRWFELGIILLGAFILRAIFLPLSPNLTHDSWRYLWDARVTLHGYSPYVYIPRDPALVHLRNITFDNSRFRDVPTLYPPGAQAVYLLSYLSAPDNMFVLKSIFTGLDLVTCGALAFLLYSRGLDPARCIIYAWCPLPILEFALQGHHEAITLTFTLLAFICAHRGWRGSRVLTGFLLAVATLTNIYPILFILVLLRYDDSPPLTGWHTSGAVPVFAFVSRGLTEIYHLLRWFFRMCLHDWPLLSTCFATLILAYVPYALLGHGHVFGFFATYVSEQSPNAGIVLLLVRGLGEHFALNRAVTLMLGYGIDLLVIGGVSVGIMWLRRYKLISGEVAMLVFIATIFAISTHVYPWYVTALLPWLALVVGPLWMRQNRFRGKNLAAVCAWYFVCISICWYFFFFSTSPAWNVYHLLVYDVTLGGLGIAALSGLMKLRAEKHIKNL